MIGTWDKTGLHVLLVIIEGSTIKGSSIIGGRINIGNGTFEVDSDGAVVISSGEIHIGNVDITEQYAWLYGFGVSGSILYSRDNGNSIQISNSEAYDLPSSLVIRYDGKRTNYTAGGINTDGDIWFSDPWTENMSALDMFKDLYDRVRALRDRIDELEG